jgi:hypothetical protein
MHSVTHLDDVTHQHRYTAIGSNSCCGFPALDCPSVEHCDQAHQDVQTYVSWGIDYIKVDSCKNYNASSFNTTHPLISEWFLEAGKAAHRPVLYHPSGVALRDEQHAWPAQYKLWGKTANMWRHFADMQPLWSEVDAQCSGFTRILYSWMIWIPPLLASSQPACVWSNSKSYYLFGPIGNLTISLVQ